jgi:hypothetical protein
MNRKKLVIGFVLSFVIILGSITAVVAEKPAGPADPVLLADGLEGGSGSTIGPGGALYVTESVAGRISRVDPGTGEVTTFAEGLPPAIANIGGADVGGAIDVAFIGDTAYALVTLVSPFGGGVDGIYRVDGPNSFTVIADLGQWSIDNPPDTAFDVPSGLQYALETFRGGFLVTDGHHNRMLRVTTDGEITELIQFDNIVPTGLTARGNEVYMAEAGPVPHLPENGKVVKFGPRSARVQEVASGAPLLVDVEFGRGRKLYALSQGDFLPGGDPAFPAEPDTGALVEVNGDGTFSVITDDLNQPTSLEFIGNNAYVVTLGGEIWEIDTVSGPPFGVSRSR